VINAGFTGFLAIASEKTDHLWILLTDEAEDPLAVLVMLTDARNLNDPSLTFEVSKRLTSQFTVSKRSAIDFARSRKLDWDTFGNIVNGPNFVQRGTVNLADLQEIRHALTNSAHTPVDVLEFCRGRRNWQP
jgi:hypothetical protein